MGLNLKDEETVALVSAVAKRLGTTKTGAVRELARDRLAQLDEANARDLQDRERAVTEWLERDVWPFVTSRRALSRAEEENLLGYDQMLPR